MKSGRGLSGDTILNSGLTRKDDRLVQVMPLLERVDDWAEFLRPTPSEEEVKRLRGHERTGRPLGGVDFLEYLEKLIGRTLKPKKPGRKPKRR